MPKLGIKCPSCGKVTAIDAARLPDKPVRLACPSCQHKIVIDKSKLLKPKEDTPAPAPTEPGQEASPPNAAPPEPSPPPEPNAQAEQAEEEPAMPPAGEPPFGTPDPGAAGEALAGETEDEPPAEPELDEPPPREPAAAAMPVTPAPEHVTVDDAGSTSVLPSGIIVGADKQAMHGLKQALIPRGCSLEHVSTAELENRLHQGLPPLILFVADEVGSPPFEPLQPVRLLPPVERRETFVVLVSNNLKTLDGSAAFFYEVNMILNKRDIPKAPQALGVALDAHQKLYRPYLAAIEERDQHGA